VSNFSNAVSRRIPARLRAARVLLNLSSTISISVISVFLDFAESLADQVIIARGTVSIRYVSSLGAAARAAPGRGRRGVG
jgi:hypothetical protein